MLSLPGQFPVHLIVDALDKCPNSSGMRSLQEQVLDLIKDFIEPPPHLYTFVSQADQRFMSSSA